ncbi:Myc-type, basic helix-loop-helix domain-containing protein [Tanacetum coccineum]
MESFEYSIGHYDNSNFNMFQPDITQETNIENLISAIRCETADPVEKLCLHYECNNFSNACMAMQLLPQLYGHNEANDGILNINTGSASGVGHDNGNGIGISCYDVMDPNLNVIWNQEEYDVKVFGDGDSSETVTTRNPDTRRKSGGGVKMDKASIVGDAAQYIHDLQAQARNLRSEIATIEAGLKTLKCHPRFVE